MKIEFTLLDEKQIIGKEKLDIFKNGVKLEVSDFSILTGAYMEGNTALFWTKTPNLEHKNSVSCFDKNGNIWYVSPTDDDVGVCPCIKLDKNIKFYDTRENFERGFCGFYYGSYPRFWVGKMMNNELENAYNDNILELSNREYGGYKTYKYQNEMFVRIIANYNEGVELADGAKIELQKPYWIMVSRVPFIIDKKANIAVAKEILFLSHFSEYYDYNGDFEKTYIKSYMNTKFLLEFNRPDHMNYIYRYYKESDTCMIRRLLKSDIPVFIHGKPGDGKSARVKQIDPDCEIIYLRNATPDSLNGKSVYNSNTGEMIDIPPTWYLKVKDKCEKEPDKIHIIFFDELTNALPSIQSMAFNIVLDGEINGKWKIPPNARIVAAGNEVEESLAANQMAEPLFSRFAHVYIKTKVNEWLYWASTSENEHKKLDYYKEWKHPKIHPLVYSYIAYKSYINQDVLRTAYDGNKPNADPRKWEMVSKMLYNGEHNIYLLKSLIGKELAKDLYYFTKIDTISISDAIDECYSDSDLDMDISGKFLMALKLSNVDEEHFEIARNFMEKLGKEFRAIFDSIWAHGDIKRLEKIREITLSNMQKTKKYK